MSQPGCTIAADKARTGTRPLQGGSRTHRYGEPRVTIEQRSAMAQGAAGAGNPPPTPPARHSQRPRAPATAGPGSRPRPGRLFESRPGVRALARTGGLHRLRGQSPTLALGRLVALLRRVLLARGRDAPGIRRGARLGAR